MALASSALLSSNFLGSKVLLSPPTPKTTKSSLSPPFSFKTKFLNYRNNNNRKQWKKSLPSQAALSALLFSSITLHALAIDSPTLPSSPPLVIEAQQQSPSPNQNSSPLSQNLLLTAPKLQSQASSHLLQGTQWRYSEFIDAVKKGYVESVRFTKDGSALQLTAVDGRRANVIVPNDPELIDILAMNGVDISVSEGESGIGLFNFISNLIFPFLAFAGLFLGPIDFGRSKSKFQEVTETGVTFADVAGADQAKRELQELVDFMKNPHKYTALGAAAANGFAYITGTKPFPSIKPFRSFKVASASSHAQAQPHPQQVAGNEYDNPVSGDSIRRRFLTFYASRGHTVLPSASLIPDDPTVLLTIAGMLQFKPIFLGMAPRQVPRATTAQRCIRTNDVENVGNTARHHTFFEMLGNFSFGDYFKKEAIKWAWELSTIEFGLPADRLWISVYKDDDEAFELWSDEVGVPVERIKRLGEEDNFWTSGVTGPCGPCSEIYYDFHPERGYIDADLGDDTRFIEFYNLVFMQYNKKDDGSLEPLKQKNIDTGLGLERMARILQKVPNNYETDLIFPIIEKASKLANVSYGTADDQTKRNLKVIGDHMRAIVFLISDGVAPSNIGRGYVVRRLIRRVVRTGRLLGIKGDGMGDLEGAFSPAIAEKVLELSTHIDADVKSRAPRILEELKREELRFVQTLERGEKLLEEKLADALLSAEKNGTVPCLAGEDVFLLYDTYGYPMEITKEVAAEHGVSVDMDSFDVEMEKQRRQSQAAHNTVKLAMGTGATIADNLPDTEFIGYDKLYGKAIVESLVVNGDPAVQASEGSSVEILLNKTPFYAESGGQIGDHGYIYIAEGEDQPKAVVEIIDVQKSLGNIFVHKGTVQRGVVEVGKEVEARVDVKLRQRAKVHHTATHLLQAALKKVIGQETSQAGSLVAFDRLRFDFNFHRSLLDSELAEIEGLINGWIEDATHLQTKVMPLVDAKRAGAIAMFGEKYGEEVRVVEVPGVSMELCGGTHVNNTSEIRGFKIISEQGIASGIRRIEAVAGEAFIEYVNARDFYLKQLCSTLKVKPEDVTTRIENLLEELREVRNENSAIRAKAAVYKASVVASKALLVGKSKQYRVLVECLDDVDAESLKCAAEYLMETLTDPAAVVLGSCPGEGKVSLVAAFTPGVVDQGIQAGKFIGQIAKLCGGGGGGRPNFAQAGGRKPENLASALEKAQSELIAVLSEKGN